MTGIGSGAAARGDKAKVTVTVGVPPEVAFEVFTQEIDSWWKRGPKFRSSGRLPGALRFEPKVGGRLFETYAEADASGATYFEVGRVLVWEPGARLVLAWRNRTFAPDEKTEVDVRFEAIGDGATQVTVEHRGWASLRRGHPARHGLEGARFIHLIGMWWGELMTSLREHVITRKTSSIESGLQR